MFDPEVFGRAMGEAIRKAVEPLQREIADLKSRLAEKPDYAKAISDAVRAEMAAIPLPKDGKDADMGELRAFIVEQIEAIPAPKDGESVTLEEVAPVVREEVRIEAAKHFQEIPKPKDGTSVTLEDVQPVLDAAIARMQGEMSAAVERVLAESRSATESVKTAVAAIEKPKDGKSVEMSDVQPVLDAAIRSMRDEAVATVEAAINAIPKVKDGKSITLEEVAPMLRAEVERAVANIPTPKDGVGLAGAFIDRDGILQLTLTSGEVRGLGVVVGKDGADLSDTTFEYDGDRTLTIHGKGGSVSKRLPIPMDRGYFRDGMPTCEKGDIVTHEGNAWIALKDTNVRPSTDAKDDWRLFARKGRDGDSIIRKATQPAGPIKLKD